MLTIMRSRDSFVLRKQLCGRAQKRCELIAYFFILKLPLGKKCSEGEE